MRVHVLQFRIVRVVAEGRCPLFNPPPALTLSFGRVMIPVLLTSLAIDSLLLLSHSNLCKNAAPTPSGNGRVRACVCVRVRACVCGRACAGVANAGMTAQPAVSPVWHVCNDYILICPPLPSACIALAYTQIRNFVNTAAWVHDHLR